MKQKDGLTDEQVIKSRKEYGDNSIGEYKKNSIQLNIGEPFNVKPIEKKEQTEYIEEKVKKLILE